VAVLVTRPAPDNNATASALRARGYDTALSPVLRFEAIPFHDDEDVSYDGIIVTSANALRAVADHAAMNHLRKLTLFAVGAASADAAREAGFKNVLSAKGDGASLRDLVVKKLKKGSTLCYLAGADLSRDLAGELGARGFTIITHTTYRMMPVSQLSADVVAAFNAERIDAVLHFSRRSARAFFEAARASGVEISALALPHCCISEAVAAVAHEAGAAQVAAARALDEAAVLDALERIVKPSSR
jgi:uroporphyrinogen-III synthase